MGRDPAGVEAVALFDSGGNLFCLEVLAGDHRCCDPSQWSSGTQTRPASRCPPIKPAQRSRSSIKESSFDVCSVAGGKGDERLRPDPGSKFSRADPPTAEPTEVTKPGVGAAFLLGLHHWTLTDSIQMLPGKHTQTDTHTHVHTPSAGILLIPTGMFRFWVCIWDTMMMDDVFLHHSSDLLLRIIRIS